MISWQTAAHWPYVEAPFPFYLVFYDRAAVALRPPAAVRGPGRGRAGRGPAHAIHHLSWQYLHNKTERKTTMRKLCDKDGGEKNIKNEVA